jgi:putative oxidoreductase
MIEKIANLVRCGVSILAKCGMIVAPPAARIALALPFFRSGLTRWDGFPTLTDSTIYLFEELFKLHIFGSEYSIPAPHLVAFFTGMGEIVLPILLVIGFATRMSALGLLAMTGVIQLVVPDGWVNFHLYWAALALSIIAMGPGPFSLDHLVKKLWP